jgi:hypothetical protein
MPVDANDPLPAPSGGIQCDAAAAALQDALSQLMSLQEGDRGVVNVVACGRDAIAPLRTLLFRREPSGLYAPRCRVVEALAALGAREVLRDFVQADRDVADPVESTGEEAVLNAAVRALRGESDEAFFQRLLALACTRRLAGPIELLGAFRRPEAVACLVAALADDVARTAAEDAIRHYGGTAQAALAAGATERDVRDGAETESSRRRRRAALGLLQQIGGAAELSRQQRDAWVRDDDPQLALSGCRLALACGDPAERGAAVRRLLDLLPMVDWQLRREIGYCLEDHSRDARPLIRAMVPVRAPDAADFSRQAEAQRCLMRLAHGFGGASIERWPRT